MGRSIEDQSQPKVQTQLRHVFRRGAQLFINRGLEGVACAQLFSMGDPVIFEQALTPHYGGDHNLVLVLTPGPDGRLWYQGNSFNTTIQHLDQGPYLFPANQVGQHLPLTPEKNSYWHELQHDLLERNGFRQDHHAVIENYAEAAIHAYKGLLDFQRRLSEAEAAARVKKLSVDQTRAIWSRPQQAWQSFCALWGRVRLTGDGALTVERYTQVTGIRFAPPAKVQEFYQQGGYHGIKPPTWIFQSRLAHQPVSLSFAPALPQRPKPALWEQTVGVILRSNNKAVSKGQLILKLNDLDPNVGMRATLDDVAVTGGSSRYIPIDMAKGTNVKVTLVHARTDLLTQPKSVTIEAEYNDARHPRKFEDATRDFEVKIPPANLKPQLELRGPTQTSLGSPIVIQAVVNPSLPDLQFLWQDGSRLDTWSLAADQAGTYPIKVEVRDAKGQIIGTQERKVTVLEPARLTPPPTSQMEGRYVGEASWHIRGRYPNQTSPLVFKLEGKRCYVSVPNVGGGVFEIGSGKFDFEDDEGWLYQGLATSSGEVRGVIWPNRTTNEVVGTFSARRQDLPGSTPSPTPSPSPSQAPVELTLQAAKTQVSPGETLEVEAQIRNAPSGYSLGWEGPHSGSGPKVTFLSRETGTHTLKCSLMQGSRVLTSGSLTITVSGLQVSLQATSSEPAALGRKFPVTATVNPASGNYRFRWQPSPEVSFDPAEGGQPTTRATFRRPGATRLFVEVLDASSGATLGTSATLDLKVAGPELTLSFQPLTPYVGQTTRARVQARPQPAEIDYRWFLPPSARLLGTSKDTSEITFHPKDTSPLAIKVAARVPFHGDDLGEKTEEVRARAYPVQVRVLAPPGPIAADQTVEVKAEIQPLPEGAVSFSWSFARPEDNHFVGVASGQQVKVQRSAAGACQLIAVAKDSEGLELGRGSADFSVVAPTVPDLSEKIKEFQKLLAQGRLLEAEKVLAGLAAADAKVAAPLARSLSQAAQQRGWLTFGSPDADLKAVIADLELAVRVDPSNTLARTQLEQARRALANEQQLRARAPEVEDLIVRRRLPTAQVRLRELDSFQTHFRTTPGMLNRLNQMCYGLAQEYQKAVDQFNLFWSECQKSRDWSAAITRIQEFLGRFEFFPGDEESLKARLESARQSQRAQETMWTRYQNLLDRHRQGIPLTPQEIQSLDCTLYHPTDPRYQAVFDLSQWKPTQAPPRALGDRLAGSQSLSVNSWMHSPNKQIRLTLQDDGNLVLTRGASVLWSPQTEGRGVTRLELGQDGALRLVSGDGRAIWQSHSGTGAGNYYLQVQDDGNAVVYAEGGGAVWATHTAQAPSPPPPVQGGQQMAGGQSLSPNSWLQSRNGHYRLTFQDDGNLVLTRGSKVLWSTQTEGKGVTRLDLGRDGAVILVSRDGQRVWQSHAGSGEPGTCALHVQDDGNVVVYAQEAGGARAVWASYTAQNPQATAPPPSRPTPQRETPQEEWEAMLASSGSKLRFTGGRGEMYSYSTRSWYELRDVLIDRGSGQVRFTFYFPDRSGRKQVYRGRFTSARRMEGTFDCDASGKNLPWYAERK
ncbi:hypothetical protein IV102_22985 [bacterium]|nr:hypothetical protein [bacterium]